MNLVVKIVSRGVFPGFSRKLVPASSFEAAGNYRRCSLSNIAATLDFKSLGNETREVLKKHGITEKSALQKVVRMPVLSSGGPDAWNNLILTLVKVGVSPLTTLNMTVKYPRLLKIPPEKLIVSWQDWLQCFKTNEIVRQLFTEFPMFFSLNQNDVLSKYKQLHAIVGSSKNVANLLEKCPQIMFQSLGDLEEASDYISMVMVVRNAGDYHQSGALGCTLSELKTRHVFLERCGKYKTPNLKHSDKIPTTNPSLSQIYDTTDEEFSTKIAGVSLEEFVVFRTMFEKEMYDAPDNSAAESDSDEFDD